MKLKRFKTRRQYVSRRLVKMNKRLNQEIGENIAEKRGYRWVLTSFTFCVWGETGDEEVVESFE